MHTYVENQIASRRSPVGLWLSGSLVEFDDEGLVMEFMIRREMTDQHEKLHGGVISTLIEEVIELMCNAAQDDFQWSCADITIKFVRSIALGQRVKVVAGVISESVSIITAEAKVYDTADQLIAAGVARLEKF